jgi:NTE family protein
VIGKPVHPASLEDKLTNLNAQGAFETLRYGIVEQSGKPGLGIVAVQKTSGPPFLNFGLIIDGSDTNDVRFGLAARLTFLNAGGFRSEWRTDFAMGDRYEIASEYYHPFTGSSNWFIAPHAVAGKRRFDLYNNRNRTSEYSIHRAGAGLDLGYALGRNAEVRVGEELIRHEINLKLGAAFVPNYARSWGDSSARFAFFGQDDSVVPRKGINSQTRVDWFSASPFGGSYRSAETKSSFFLPVSQNGSIFLNASAGSAFSAKNLGLESFTLGGPFRLGAYGINELIGKQYLLFQGGYSHRILTFNPLFGGAVYGLAWYETGKIYGDPAAPRLPMDGSVAIVAKTGLGPVFAGASMAATDRIKWWFGLGHVF